MSPKLIGLDVALLAALYHQEIPWRHDRLVLQHAARMQRHPQLHPQRQMRHEKPCAPYRQSARPPGQTLTAPYFIYLSRLRVRYWFAYSPTAFSILPAMFWTFPAFFSAAPFTSRLGLFVSSPAFCLIAQIGRAHV